MREQTKNLREITARLKHTEQVLDASEDKYRQLVENADCIILRVDINGNILFFNEFAQKLFGYSDGEILGKNVVGTIVPKIDRLGRDFSTTVKAIRRYPKRYTTYESENICKNGRHVWIIWANKIIRNQQKKNMEILCVGHDITERKGMERDLQLLAAVVHSSNDAIIVQDLKGNIISWNLGAERMYGFSKTEAMKLNIGRIIPEHKRNEMQTLIERLKKGEKIGSFDTIRLAKDGRALHVSLTAMLLKDEAGKSHAVTFTERDITERRHLEKDILDITERERQLIGEEMHDSMGQILTGVAIKSKGLALKLKGKSRGESKNALAISKLASLAIAQMRDLARMLYPVDIETGGLITALQSLASNSEKLLNIICRFQCKTPVFVNNLVEAKQLYRITQESITNAVRHGKAKKIEIELQAKDDICTLSVKDDGRGFQKSPGSKNGLGLKIMEYRANLIGGVLNIRKDKKGGTVVTCTVPNTTEQS